MRPLFRRRRDALDRTFEALVRRHLDRLHRLAYRFTGSTHDAEDLLQSLLAKLYPQVDRLAEVEELGPWLARALYNLYVDQVRRRESSPLDLALPDDEAEARLESIVDEASESPEEVAERWFTGERLAAALMQLPGEQRAVIAWHDIEGYTLEELAEAHDIPIGTLKSRLHRARARLREILLEPFAAAARVAK
jgi:RNA polymerase sigma-70 factor (ECF subfamily)